MIQLTIKSACNTAELFISQESEMVDFTVTTFDNKQYDFCIEKEEWELFKEFIDTQFTK